MDAFISRKRRRLSPPASTLPIDTLQHRSIASDEEESTDLKLAILSSLHADRDAEFLLDLLLSHDGSVAATLKTLDVKSAIEVSEPKQKVTVIGMQTALPFTSTIQYQNGRTKSVPLTKKGKTLHLYTPEDIALHTPCSIVHNFLPSQLANELLRELLPESESFESASFKLFDNVVKSPHTACFYVDSLDEEERQMNEYLYNGSKLDDVRQILPFMRKVSHLVKEAVNKEITFRIRNHYPDGKKLKYQTPKEWVPNAAFVNCYDGGAQSVGWHADQLSYVGVRPVIGSLSLGVAREFRVRKIVAKEEDDKGEAADASGQIAIHLPHNSLLVMHAEMQEEWKHSIAPAQSIDPHPIAGNKRINITYRWYRPEFQPRYIPDCKCGAPAVLKTVQRQKQNRGRYMWMCQTAGRADGGDGCGYFEWAEFTDDGDPILKSRRPQKPIKVEASPQSTSSNVKADPMI